VQGQQNLLTQVSETGKKLKPTWTCILI